MIFTVSFAFKTSLEAIFLPFRDQKYGLICLSWECMLVFMIKIKISKAIIKRFQSILNFMILAIY